MKKGQIFFHIFPWKDKFHIIDEQLETIHSSGVLSFADLNCCIVDTKFRSRYRFPEWVSEESIRTVKHCGTEWSTLKELDSSCRGSPYPDNYTLYIHTKGAVKDRMHGCNHTWRQFMMYFLVEKWEEAIEVLDSDESVGAVGCNLKNKQPRGKYKRTGGPFELWHFAGNFWWCRNSSILDLPVAGSDAAQSIDTWQGHKRRLAAERWIGELGQERLHCIHRAKVNVNMVPYTRDLYAE